MSCSALAWSAMAYSARCRRSASASREIASYSRPVSASWASRMSARRPTHCSDSRIAPGQRQVRQFERKGACGLRVVGQVQPAFGRIGSGPRWCRQHSRPWMPRCPSSDSQTSTTLAASAASNKRSTAPFRVARSPAARGGWDDRIVGVALMSGWSVPEQSGGAASRCLYRVRQVCALARRIIAGTEPARICQRLTAGPHNLCAGAGFGLLVKRKMRYNSIQALVRHRPSYGVTGQKLMRRLPALLSIFLLPFAAAGQSVGSDATQAEDLLAQPPAPSGAVTPARACRYGREPAVGCWCSRPTVMPSTNAWMSAWIRR